ncbi:octopamine receptor beta-3R [Eurytemora carolleeae]|uniref:octopamine receptor beta-3R n=1 Tax=Eurytemora carolleeae TaxID=1294199 RepID=UPI000C787A01|nr:octopamine receptor beta-3R [Eurytemora carolleeae]|eukprot:XP_023331498.1 octopamine receptor beta-3R-like [Eurytemora affinis]
MNLSITLALTDFEQHQDKEEDRMLDIDVHSFIALDLMKNINVSGRIEIEASLGLIFKGTIFSLMILLTMCGNSLVLIAISNNTVLQRPCNFFLASLAIADLGVGSLVMVPSAIDEVFGWWPFGPFCCQLYNAMDVTCCTVSILHLCAVSIDRYYAIVKEPLLYQSSVTKWRTVCLLILVWVMGLLIGFVSVFSGMYTTDTVLDNIYENPQECHFEVNKVYSVVAGGVSFWLPAVLMVYIYIRVYMEAVKLDLKHNVVNNLQVHLHENQTFNPPIETRNSSETDIGSGMMLSPSGNHTSAQLSSSMSHLNPRLGEVSSSMLQINLNSSHELSSSGQRTNRANERRKEVKAAVSLGFIMGGFLVCWLPFFIWMPLVHLMEIETPHNLYLYIQWIGYFNSGINPVIYGLHHQEFKQIFARYFLWLRRKICCLKCLREASSSVDIQPGFSMQDKWV